MKIQSKRAFLSAYLSVAQASYHNYGGDTQWGWQNGAPDTPQSSQWGWQNNKQRP